MFHIAGLDVGFENPMFACLEFDYEDADEDATADLSSLQQSLTYYELDLGLLTLTSHLFFPPGFLSCFSPQPRRSQAE